MNEFIAHGHHRQDDLLEAAKRLVAVAAEEGRDLSPDEGAQVAAAADEYDRIQAQLGLVGRITAADEARAPAGRKTSPDALHPGNNSGRWGARPRNMATSMFPTAVDMAGFRDGQDWFASVLSGRLDPRLSIRAVGSRTDVGEAGGYMMPVGLSAALLDDVVQASPILSACRRIPIDTKNVTFPYWEQRDRSQALLAGMAAVWIPEGGTSTDQTAKAGQLSVVAKKLGIYTKATREILDDSPFFQTEFQPALVAAARYSLDRALTRGTGTGQPLGMLADPSALTIAAEGSQAADTFLWPNAIKVYSAMYAAGTNRAVWLVHPTVVPQLLAMQNVVRNQANTENVGGVPAVTVSDDGTMRLIGRPVVVNEHQPVLGDLGDVMLADLSQYCLFMRKEVSVETSNAPGWYQDEISFRTILRLDAMGLWAAAGKRPGDTQPSESWLVRLAAR